LDDTLVQEKEDKKEGTLIDTLHIEGEVDKSYVPDGYETRTAFLKEMREEYANDLEADRENRDQALSDKKFAAGEQWDPVVLEQRRGLPCLTINTIPQFTAQLVGDWRESRRGIKVVAANDEDKDIAKVREELFREIENQSRASRVYDSAFESLVQCGDGAFRVSIEYARTSVFDQNLYIRPIEDCLSVVWDRFSVDPTGRDAKRCFVNDRIPKNEYHRKYGDIPADELEDQAKLVIDLETNGWTDDTSYQVTEYWRLIERTRLMALFENGEIFIIDDSNIDDLVAQYGMPVKTRSTQVSFAQMHLCTGFDILSGPFEYQLNRLPIIRMVGRVTNVGGRRVRAGVVRDIKDPARMKNFFRSVAAEQLGMAPKAKWMVTEAAVEGREADIRKAHVDRDPLLIFNDEAEFGRNVQRVDPPGIEAALLNEAAVNTQDMKDVTGLHDASLGIRSNETSGRAIMARQREGDIANLSFHDNANHSVLEAADVVNQLIPAIYDGTRILRVIGEDDKEKFVRVNDPFDPNSIDLSKGMFDVVPQTGASYSTKRIEAAQAMMEAIQVYPDLMSIAGDLVANAQDWPGAEKLAERLKKTIPPHLLGEDEEGGGLGVTAQELQEMQQKLQELSIKNQELELAAKNKERENIIAAYNAETQRLRALSDHEVDNKQLQHQAMKNILDGAVKLDEIEQKERQMNKPTPGGISNAPSPSGAMSQ
jgi:hypothetical protein